MIIHWLCAVSCTKYKPLSNWSVTWSSWNVIAGKFWGLRTITVSISQTRIVAEAVFWQNCMPLSLPAWQSRQIYEVFVFTVENYHQTNSRFIIKWPNKLLPKKIGRKSDPSEFVIDDIHRADTWPTLRILKKSHWHVKHLQRKLDM